MPSSTTPWRLLIDPPQAGAWNMAVDEALLEWSAAGGGCAWRFYRWTEATLSLGYFQPYHRRDDHPPSRACPAVRRLTGGGAIVHDAELTYSLVVPAGHRLATDRDRLYETVHLSLVAALADWGIAAALCRPQAAPRQPEPFLCFLRRAPGDVLVGRTKIAGGAQRRRRGAVLQHGSVLLGRSPAAPELPGLADLGERGAEAGSPGPDELIDAWLPRLAGCLCAVWRVGPLADDQRRRAAELEAGRYAGDAWTVRRQR